MLTLTLFVAILMTFIGALSLWQNLYLWSDYRHIMNNSRPRIKHPKFKFSIIIPARREEQVIGQTLESLLKLEYPTHLIQIIVVCPTKDPTRIKVMEFTRKYPGKISLITVSDTAKVNKPFKLNHAFSKTSGDYILIVDAEDEIHPDLLLVANTLLLSNKADILQAGVQLINWTNAWFGSHNALEYMFWFRSRLHSFARLGVTPLGGNTVFIKHNLLKKLGGWDPQALTEDADLGVRSQLLGAKLRVFYHPAFVTKEEIPATLKDFVKQRSRWIQGFFQIIASGNWLTGNFTKSIGFLYLFLFPLLQALLLVWIVAVFALTRSAQPAGLVTFTFVPLIFIWIQIWLNIYGLYWISKTYKVKWSTSKALLSIFTLIPYQLLISYCGLRAAARYLRGNFAWEKTPHLNLHRLEKYVTTA